MHIEWLLLAVFFLFNLIVFLVITEKIIIRERKISLGFIFDFFFFVSFGVVPLIFSFCYGLAEITFSLKDIISFTYSSSECCALFFVGFLSLAFFLIFNYCYFKMSIRNKKEVRLQHFSNRNVILLAYFCLMFGAISLVLWTSHFGGPLEFIRMASSIRGDSNNSFGNKFAMFKQPAKLLMPSCFIFFGLVLKKKKRLSSIIGFVLSLFMAIIYLFANDGRLTFVSFFVALIFEYIYSKKIIIDYSLLAKLFGLLVLGIIVITSLDSITYFIRNGQIQETSHHSPFLLLMDEYLFVIKSGQTSVQNNVLNIGEFKIFNEIISGLFAWLPNSIKPVSVQTVWQYNTSINLSSATIPCDVISESVFDLGILGPLLCAAFLSLIISRIQNKINLSSNNPYYLCLYAGFVMITLRLPSYFSLYDFMINIFPYVCIYFLSVIMNLFGLKNKNIINRGGLLCAR